MAKATFMRDGKVIQYTNNGETDIAYGDIVVLTDMVSVANSDIPKGMQGALAITGAFEMPAETTSVFEVGQAVYWDAENSVVTLTADGNIKVGVTLESKTQAASSVLVKIGA